MFGHELGSGAFSTVKYAKLIQPGKSAAVWPEYAVKTIKTELILERSYEHSVRREIAVLQLLSHPGIARLITSFRWREGAYLVLEYGAGGDLHTKVRACSMKHVWTWGRWIVRCTSHLLLTLLISIVVLSFTHRHQITKMGSLDEASTQFIIGEVVAALKAIHSAGFVYGDLKPENIILTSSGHAKLTDFGAVRPYTDEARGHIAAARNALRSMRSGDWKPEAELEAEQSTAPSGTRRSEERASGEAASDEDSRLEGTAVYLAPELVKGQATSPAADCWALGCLVYQCLAGRPPVWAETETEVRCSDCECLPRQTH